MNKQETIEALQEQLARMQEKINEISSEMIATQLSEAKKQASAALTPMLNSFGVYSLSSYNFNPMEIDCGVVAGNDANVFPDEETAQGYAEAFKVQLALRRCEGAGHYYDNEGYALSLSRESNAYLDYYDKTSSEMFTFFPPFPTEALAEAAMNKVGKDRIIASARFLANYKGD